LGAAEYLKLKMEIHSPSGVEEKIIVMGQQKVVKQVDRVEL